MAYEKIATCCYCGTRAALVLRGSKRHELACSSCGAPLHDLKRLPATNAKKSQQVPRFAGVLNALLPLPSGLNYRNNPIEFKKWLKANRSQLRWDESLERYILDK